MFWEEWLMMAKVLLGMSLLGLVITWAVGSDVLAGFFARLSLIALASLLVGKLCQWISFKRQ